MSESTRYHAIHEADEGRVHVDYQLAGRLDVERVASFRTPDTGDLDALLRANGWRRISAWLDADDVASGARQAMVEPSGLITRVNGTELPAGGDRP